MEIEITKNFKRKNRTIKKGTRLLVTNEYGNELIKEKKAKKVKNDLFKLFKPKGVYDGTKQTAKYKPKEEGEENE